MAAAIVIPNVRLWKTLARLRRYFARTGFSFVLFLPHLASADDWGCQVLLCLADPRGPETESACVPPIEKLWTALAHLQPFPTCDFNTSLTDIPEDAKSLLPPSALTAGQGTGASNTWASGNYCREDMLSFNPDGAGLACSASGAINVKIDGALYTRIWWSTSGGATTNEFYGAGSNAVDYDPTMSAQKFIALQNSSNVTSDGGGGE